MCSSGSAVTLTCAGHCLPSPKLLWCQLRHRNRDLQTFWFCLSSLLPAFLSTYQSFPAFSTVLCGCSFTLTSACLWTKLLMAFSGLSHERGWQSKWAQGLSASSSKQCLHLEPDTKATVVGTFPFVSVHFESGKLDIVEEKKNKNEWKCLKKIYIFPGNTWSGSAEQSLRRMIVPAFIWVKMKLWECEDAGKPLLEMQRAAWHRQISKKI